MKRLSIPLILLVAALIISFGAATVVAAADEDQRNPAVAPNSRGGGVALQGEARPAPYGRRDPGPASTPEAPIAVLLPIVGIIAAGGAWYLVISRRQQRQLL